MAQPLAYLRTSLFYGCFLGEGWRGTGWVLHCRSNLQLMSHKSLISCFPDFKGLRFQVCFDKSEGPLSSGTTVHECVRRDALHARDLSDNSNTPYSALNGVLEEVTNTTLICAYFRVWT